MKKFIIKIESDEKSFQFFKKEKIKYQKIFLSKLWNFSKKKGLEISLDFRNLNNFEKPEFKDLKDVKFIFVNKDTKNIFDFIKKNKKIIYSFGGEENYEKELKTIFKKDKNISEKDFQKFLKNIFLNLNIEEYSEEYIFKKIVYIKKILIKVLNKKDAEKIKILLKNNFSWEINEDILENKLLKVDGIILE